MPKNVKAKKNSHSTKLKSIQPRSNNIFVIHSTHFFYLLLLLFLFRLIFIFCHLTCFPHLYLPYDNFAPVHFVIVQCDCHNILFQIYCYYNIQRIQLFCLFDRIFPRVNDLKNQILLLLQQMNWPTSSKQNCRKKSMNTHKT